MRLEQDRLEAIDGVLIRQVTDDGPATSGQGNSPDAGTVPWSAEHSHGLWLIEQVADKFTIDRGPAGTTVTVVFTLRDSSGQRSLPDARSWKSS